MRQVGILDMASPSAYRTLAPDVAGPHQLSAAGAASSRLKAFRIRRKRSLSQARTRRRLADGDQGERSERRLCEKDTRGDLSSMSSSRNKKRK